MLPRQSNRAAGMLMAGPARRLAAFSATNIELSWSYGVMALYRDSSGQELAEGETAGEIFKQSIFLAVHLPPLLRPGIGLAQEMEDPVDQITDQVIRPTCA